MVIIAVHLNNEVMVATALTVYGIETLCYISSHKSIALVATALTVYGIETSLNAKNSRPVYVATALTVYGIETFIEISFFATCAICCNSTYRLRY